MYHIEMQDQYAFIHDAVLEILNQKCEDSQTRGETS